MANCSSCAKKGRNTNSSTAAKVASSAASTAVAQGEMAIMNDSDYILILYTHPNRGRHGVVGAATKKNYGYRSGGEQFLVHRADVAAQPQFYRVIQSAERITVTQPTPPVPPPPVLKPTVPPIPPMPRKKIRIPNIMVDDVESATSAGDEDDEETAEMLQNIVAAAKPTRDLDLGLLPGVTPAIEKNLRLAGIVTIDDFVNAGVDGLVSVKYIGQNKAEAIMAYIETIS